MSALRSINTLLDARLRGLKAAEIAPRPPPMGFRWKSTVQDTIPRVTTEKDVKPKNPEDSAFFDPLYQELRAYAQAHREEAPPTLLREEAMEARQTPAQAPQQPRPQAPPPPPVRPPAPQPRGLAQPFGHRHLTGILETQAPLRPPPRRRRCRSRRPRPRPRRRRPPPRPRACRRWPCPWPWTRRRLGCRRRPRRFRQPCPRPPRHQ
jgi:hypothetical protein